MDEKERQKQRRKRQRARKRKKFFKNVLVFFAIIILALSAFLITVKICKPDFEISSLLPKEKTQQVVKFVNEDILGKTTTELTTVTTTTTTTTRPSNYDYDEFSEFAFDTSLQGNQLGNLLNETKGAVTYSSSYIYYSIDKKGFYRFEPNSESNAAMNVKDYTFRYLNVLGDYIYMVDTATNKLVKSQVVGGDLVTVSGNISFAYLYNDKIYFISTENEVGFINTADFNKTVLYKAPAGKTVSFVGISLSRVFFTQHDDATDYTEYITVNLKDSDDKRYFREDTRGNDITNMQIECGYFYYYEKQQDDSFNLVRQKFGSEQTVVLVENCTMTDYPVVYGNRVYFTDKKGSKIHAKELNMNTKDVKIMVTANDVSADAKIGVGYGYQYVYLFGSSNGSKVYRGSCIYTSASRDNTLTFSKGKWSY